MEIITQWSQTLQKYIFSYYCKWCKIRTN